ncbi:toxin-antitoxin system HicB family antitoxin [Streptomyces sp. NPDC127105]|uniref:toxin-antitoxin system HicB family antitoxin n=1 Tax=Streptomyces sp. NPDC127105 TaxID=3345359 RepID=UPI003665958D
MYAGNLDRAAGVPRSKRSGERPSPASRGWGGTYRPKAGGVNLRLPDDLHDRAKAAAADDDRSLNSWLVAVVRRAVESARTPSRPGGDSAASASLHGSGHSPRP